MTEQDTKSRILDAAEMMFAEYGFAGASLRSITNEAGVNLAAVNYHFGSKEALLIETLGRRLEPLNLERMQMLDALEAESGESPPELEKILEAFLYPTFRRLEAWGDDGAKFLRLAGKMHLDANEEIRSLLIRHFDEVFHRFLHAIQRSIPELEIIPMAVGIHYLVGAMIHTLSWSEHMNREIHRRTGISPPDTETIVTMMVRFTAAGFRRLAAEGKGDRS